MLLHRSCSSLSSAFSSGPHAPQTKEYDCQGMGLSSQAVYLIQKTFHPLPESWLCQTWKSALNPSFFNNLDQASILNWDFAKIYYAPKCATHCIRDFMCLPHFSVVHIQGNLNGVIVYMVVCSCLFFFFFATKLFHLWFEQITGQH